MKKILLILNLLFCLNAFAQVEPGASHIWEQALFGDKPGITFLTLSGINGAGGTAYEALWRESTAYAPGIVALVTPICASSSANDTAAGTGARTITVKGLDTSFAAFTETVTLNGTTVVAMTTPNILMMNSIEVATAGSGGLNAGIVQCGVGDAGAGDLTTPHAYLQVSSATVTTNDGNKSEQFIYGVPAGYSLICKNFVVGSLGTTAANTMYFVIDSYTNLGLLKRTQIAMLNQSGGSEVINTMVKFPEKTIIVGKVAGVTTTTGPFHMSANCLLLLNSWVGSAQGLF